MQFEGEAGEKLCKAIAVFAANQTKAMKHVKEFSKNPKFKKFVLVRRIQCGAQYIILLYRYINAGYFIFCWSCTKYNYNYAALVVSS